MTFDRRYPNASYGFETLSGVFVTERHHAKPCWICGRITCWIDLNFQAPLCSEECERTANKRFANAYNRYQFHRLDEYLELLPLR